VVKTAQLTLIFVGNGSHASKILWTRFGITLTASTESVSLHRLVRVARGPLRRGARLEAISPIG